MFSVILDEAMWNEESQDKSFSQISQIPQIFKRHECTNSFLFVHSWQNIIQLNQRLYHHLYSFISKIVEQLFSFLQSVVSTSHNKDLFQQSDDRENRFLQFVHVPGHRFCLHNGTQSVGNQNRNLFSFL